MMKKIAGAIVLAQMLGSVAYAADYSSLEGKSGAALKAAVKEIAKTHTEISYGDKTWDAFSTCDVRMVEGQEAWFDMYSNRLVYVSTGHSGMNIEHAVANSWWGGTKNAAYKDLHHLNPSDADANNRKNDNPLGIVAGNPNWSNGVTKIGAPVAGIGGGSKSVFEPAEQFKGDFARAYFYVFTIYDDITWETAPACMYELSTYPTLQPWAYEMLLDWARQDPVDTRESERNVAVSKVQRNENPFVSIPGLAEYIWGSKKNQPFKLADAMTPIADRPEAPVPVGYDLAALNTWTGRWWEATDIALSCPTPDVDIYYTLTDSEDYQLLEGNVEISGASAMGEIVTLKAYAQSKTGAALRSPVATLTLTAIDASTTDYKNTKWQLVEDDSEINESDLYIVCSVKAFDVMGCEARSSSSSGYLTASGSVVPEAGVITGLPDGAGIIQLVSDGGGLYYVAVNDLMMRPQGYLLTNEAKKLSLSADGRAAAISINSDSTASINFGEQIGTLQYNASQPRYSVYTSNQQKVSLYKYAGGITSGVERPILPENAEEKIFTLDGRPVNNSEGLALPAGIYIKVCSGGKVSKMMVK